MDFFSHPYWPLLMFGFAVAPRILLLCLWLPIKDLGAVIAYPLLSYIGWVFVPRFTLACIFMGFYWNTNKVLCIIAFVISIILGESFTSYMNSSSPILLIYANNLPLAAKFILSLDVIVPIVGGLIMLVTYGIRRQEKELNQETPLGY